MSTQLSDGKKSLDLSYKTSHEQLSAAKPFYDSIQTQKK